MLFMGISMIIYYLLLIPYLCMFYIIDSDYINIEFNTRTDDYLKFLRTIKNIIYEEY